MSAFVSEFVDFLSSLPGLENPAERKALLAFSGQAFVGLYLDFVGNQAEFAEALVALVCGHGQGFALQFLAALKNAPQVDSTNQAQLVGLIDQLAVLSTAEWEAAFAAVTPTQPITSAAHPPDPEMLTMSLVSDLLLPYYTLGAENLQNRSGAAVVAKAQRAIEILTANAQIRPFLTMFKAAPVATEAGFLTALNMILAADANLARELAEILTAAVGEETAVLSTLVKISQEIRVVSGDVVGAVVGQEVVGKLSLKQTVDTVSTGGTLIGAVIGAPSAARIGGKTVEGDYVAGDKVDGDKVGGDKIVGDQIKTGDIADSSGIAIGRDAAANAE